MIQQIKIEKFKNIESVELWLDKINILIGANNSGKSSILQAIQFAISVAQSTRSLGARWQIEKKRCPASLSSQNLIYTPLRDVEALAPKGKLKTKLEDAIKIIFFGCDIKTEITIRKGKNRNIATAINGITLGKIFQNIQQPYSIMVPGLAGIAPYEEFKSESIVRKAAAKGDANNYFRNILLLLSKNTSSWNKFNDKFNDIFPSHNISIEFNNSLDDIINIFIENENCKLPIDSCGTGMLQVIQIVSYYYLYKPKLLILDEPDSHLHPDNQKQLATTIKNISDENECQIIISTHSRNLLDSLKKSASIKWIRNGKIAEGEESERDILMDIGALGKGDLLQDGNISHVLLTEDSDVKFIKTLLLSNGFNEEQLDIWSYNGCSQLNVALAINSFIKQHAPATRVILHRDLDYMTEEECESFKNGFVGSDIDIFLTEGNDTEWHFINPEHIHQLYNSLSLTEINQIIDEVIIDKKTSILEKIINTKHTRQLQLSYKGGERPNAGAISTESNELMDADPRKNMHGKIVYRNICNSMQRQLGGQIDLCVSTDHISNTDLQRFATPIVD